MRSWVVAACGQVVSGVGAESHTSGDTRKDGLAPSHGSESQDLAYLPDSINLFLPRLPPAAGVLLVRGSLQDIISLFIQHVHN